MDDLQALTSRLVALRSGENQALALFAGSHVPRLDRSERFRDAASSLSAEASVSLREEKEKADEEEKPLWGFLESALLRARERGGTLHFEDEILNGLAERQIPLARGLENHWQTFDGLREAQEEEERRRIGSLLEKHALRFLELGGRILEERLGFCEDQGWTNAGERRQALYGDPGQLAGAERNLLSELTGEPYRELLDHFSRKLAGVSPAALKPEDLSALLSHPAFDPLFSQGEMVMSPVRYLGRIGFDPKAEGRIRPIPCGPSLPWGEARALPVEIPTQIVLLHPTKNGIRLFESYLMEQGRALYLASLEPSAPLPRRWFEDPTLSEAYGRLWTLCLLNGPWLKRILKADRAKDVLVYTTFRFLYQLRLWTGAIRFEDRLYPGGSPQKAYSEWAEILREACLFEGGAVFYLREICAETPAAVSLYALCLAAQMGNYLRERFDEDWFVNPRTGEFLRDLWHGRRTLTAGDLWALTGGGSSWTAPLKTLLEENLR